MTFTYQQPFSCQKPVFMPYPEEKSLRKQRSEENAEMRAARGKAFGAWLRAAMINKATGDTVSNAELSRMTGITTSLIRVYANDCFDAYEERYKFPKEAQIDIIAAKLGADANEGRQAAGRMLKAGTDVPEDKMEALRYIKDPDAQQVVRYLYGMPKEMRAAAVEAMRGLANAGDIARQINERNTIGKRADRDERRSSEEESGDDGTGGDYSED